MIDDGEYTKLLRFPVEKYPVIYRGMTLEANDLYNLIDSEIQGDEVGDWDVINFSGVARPKADTASWTIDEKVALNFSSSGIDPHEELSTSSEKTYGIIVHAKSAENADKLILNPDTIYNVRAFASYGNEREVIAVGDIKFFKITYGRLV